MSLIRCPDCGKKISIRADYCPNCGCSSKYFSTNEKINSPTTTVPPATDFPTEGADNNKAASISSITNESVSYKTEERNKLSSTPTYQCDNPYSKKMGWFIFLIYFFLPASILVSLPQLFDLLSYFGAPDTPLAYYFNALMTLFLIALIGCIHYGLRKYIQSSPLYLIFFFAITVVVALNELLFFYADYSVQSNAVTKILAGTIHIIINSIYFRHRKQLFNTPNKKYSYVTISILVASIISSFAYCILIPTSKSYIVTETSSIISDNTPTGTSESTTEINNSAKDSSPSNFNYIQPEYNDQSFISHSLNIKLKLPNNLKYNTKDEMIEFDGVSSSDFYSDLCRDIQNGIARSEMLAKSEDGLTTISVRILYTGKLTEDIFNEFNILDYVSAEETKKELDATEVNVSDISGIFCQKQYKGVIVTINFDTHLTLYEYEYIIFNDNYIGYIMVTGSSPQECEKYMQHFEPYK
ncbi:zinc ribbon domain-containing protein [Butyrivibrio sp. LB2008]|uniref:zinc ribbon domain-containing protein n=1 Tax=Butyrivibrio sp. LB2008 TaxID=1408305 RepID=UPI00047B896D|nr:zinc ribbon domain-containing protein [Butyrivibrio sp. LB2008]